MCWERVFSTLRIKYAVLTPWESTGKFFVVLSSCSEPRVQGSHWGGTEGIYGLWICTIVMLMWSDASDDPQRRIILCEPAPRLHWIHNSPADTRAESEDYQLHLKINVGKLSAISALILTLARWMRKAGVCILSCIKKSAWPAAVAPNLLLVALQYRWSEA